MFKLTRKRRRKLKKKIAKAFRIAHFTVDVIIVVHVLAPHAVSVMTQ